MRDRTFVMIKPDAIGRGLKGEISVMLLAGGFMILRARTQKLSKADAEFLYDEHSTKTHFNDLVAFTTSGEVFLMEVEGEAAILNVRALVCPSDIKAASEMPWTIRGKYAEDHLRNCVHSSDGIFSAARELKYFFGGRVEMTRTSLGQVDASSNNELKEFSMTKSKKESGKSAEGKTNKPKEVNTNGVESTSTTPKKVKKTGDSKKIDHAETPKESNKSTPKNVQPKKGPLKTIPSKKASSKQTSSKKSPSKKAGIKSKRHPVKTLDAYTLARNDVMIEYSPLVRMVAYKIAAKLPPSVDVNDLISTGYLGLIDAFKRFDKSKNVKFKTYAEIRVAGAIQDELRSMDWLPRSVRDTIKKIERAREDVEKRLGNNTSEEDVASQLGVGIDEYQEAIGRVKNLSLVSIDDCFVSGQGEKGLAIHEKFADTTSVDPYTTIHAKKIREHLIRHISRLSEEHRAILGIYYFEEMSLREIGRIFNVSESRISQLHTQAIIKVWTDLRRSLRHDKLNEVD